MKNIFLSLFVIVLVIFDLFLKSFFFTRDITFSFWIFYIKPVLNPGSAFSGFSSIPFYSYLIVFLTLLLIGFIIYEFKKRKLNLTWQTLYVFLASGAIGNGFDRIMFGSVRDYLGIRGFSIINLADIYLTIAGIILIYILFVEEKTFFKKKKTNI